MSLPLTKQDDIFGFGQDDIEALIRRMEPRIRAAFIQAVITAQRENTLDQLTELARQGRLMEVLESIANSASASLADTVNVVLVESGQTVTVGMANAFNTLMSFDAVNFRAVQIMQANRLRLVVEFTQAQRLATRQALVNAIRRGLNPRATAIQFRASIGLTQRMQATIDNFRRLLEEGSTEALTRELRDRRFDSTVRAAARGDRVLTEEQIDRMVDRYRERMLKFRSEVIARTEALRAVHEGTEEGFQQALDNGVIEADTIVREWVTARDTRVRDTHESMNNQKRGVGEPFVSGAGVQLRYPGDINAPPEETIQCRCSVTTRVQRLVRS